MAYWLEHSLGIAPQVSGFGTAATADADFKYLLGEKPSVQLSTEKVELDLMTGQVGSAAERLVGRRGATITFKMPLEGLKDGYDPTAENPGGTGVLPHWACIAANVLGSNIAVSNTAVKFWQGQHLSLSEYTAAGVIAGGSTSLIKTSAPGTSNKIAVGELVAVATAITDTAPQFGFAKTKAVQDITLFAAATNSNANGDNVYGSGTAWLSANHGDQLPMTFRWKGENAEACYVLSDAVCTGIKLTWEAGEVPTIEFTYQAYEFQVNNTLGTLEVPDDFYRIPQIVGINNGRATLSGNAVCGLEATTLEYTVEVTPVKCHSATQGITGIAYRKPRIKASISIPWASTDPVYDAAGGAIAQGSHYWQSLYERGVSVDIGCYVGSNIGRLFGFLIPAGVLTDAPQIADLNGSVGYQLSFEAGSYTGDTSDTAETSATSPIDSIFRLGVA